MKPQCFTEGTMSRYLCISFFFLLCAANLQGQTSTGSAVKCTKCNYWASGSTHHVLKSHYCSKHGMFCTSGGTTTTAPVVTKSAEQIRREREAKDTKEAAEYANDLGVECYRKKDWACAIRYFKESLEYDPDFEDAKYNLAKAEEKERLEEQQRKQQTEEPIPATQTITIPAPLQRYMNEADRIQVPPPSWESNLAEQANLVRLGQDKAKYLMLADNSFMSVLDMTSKWDSKTQVGFKLLIIGGKSLIAAQDEAEIVLFKQAAVYERVLMVLKDKKKAPVLIAAIKSLREKKVLPPGTSSEIAALAKATQDPSKGTSSVQIMMNAMLSKEAKAAFIQTATAELKVLVENIVTDEVKGKIGLLVQNRSKALREVNEKINEGEDMLAKEKDPLIKSFIQFKVDDLKKKISPFKDIPDAISNVVSFFDDLKDASANK